jgi:hypothetical protein
MSMDRDDTPAAPAAAAHPTRARGPRRRRRLLVAGAVGLPVMAFVLWWFQPQALLFDDVVDESFPIGADAEEADDPAADDTTDREPAAEDEPDREDEPDTVEAEPDDDAAADDSDAEDTPSEEPETAPTGPAQLATGSFVSRNRYTVTGTATTYELEDGQRILRLEDFESTNGPDLFVYLTVAGSADDDAALDADFIDLGVLTGNIGNQNYAIPDEVDLDRYTSVVIWCRRFTTSFGVADLSQV